MSKVILTVRPKNFTDLSLPHQIQEAASGDWYQPSSNAKQADTALVEMGDGIVVGVFKITGWRRLVNGRYTIELEPHQSPSTWMGQNVSMHFPRSRNGVTWIP